MKKKMMLLCLSMITFISFGCQNSKKTTDKPEEKHEIIMGVTGGPYNTLFDDAIAPILEKEGYKIKRVTFSKFMQSNTALAEGSIDVNVAQHTAYMNIFNKEKKTDLVPLVATPSIPCNLYSSKYKSKSDLKDGMIIGIPQDPSNAARAYAVLAKAGFIKVDPKVKETDLTSDSIIENSNKLQIKEMDSNTLPHVLDDLDFEVIPGSVVEDSGVNDKLNTIEEETIIKDLEIVAAVTEKNKNTDWAKAIKKAYTSKEFLDYMNTHNENNYWVIPKN